MAEAASRTKALAATAGVIAAAGLAGAAGTPAAADASPRAGVTTRVSVSSTGEQANSYSSETSISADGRYVAFQSFASNLVVGDTNGAPDVFVRDLGAGSTQRVSVRTNGGQANDGSYFPAISADGRYVAFQSFASNLAVGDTNGASDVFVRDLVAGTTQRVSVRTDGGQANGGSYVPAISTDGGSVAFHSHATNLVAGDTNDEVDVFVRDLAAGTTRRVSVRTGGGQANSDSYFPAISGDGRYVAFQSSAANLVADDTNDKVDVYVRDRVAGTTSRVSVGRGGRQSRGNSQYPAISADGRYVAFASFAGNLAPGDTNHVQDVFVRNLVAEKTRRVSVGPDGQQADHGSHSATIAANGRRVAFTSDATNLVTGDTNDLPDVFVRDWRAGTTRLVSVDSNGLQANGYSANPAISADGRYVAFGSEASNLVPADTNRDLDVFVRTRALQ